MTIMVRKKWLLGTYVINRENDERGGGTLDVHALHVHSEPSFHCHEDPVDHVRSAERGRERRRRVARCRVSAVNGGEGEGRRRHTTIYLLLETDAALLCSAGRVKEKGAECPPLTSIYTSTTERGGRGGAAAAAKERKGGKRGVLPATHIPARKLRGRERQWKRKREREEREEGRNGGTEGRKKLKQEEGRKEGAPA